MEASKIENEPFANERQTLIRQLQDLGEIVSTETAAFQQVAAERFGLGITDMKALSILLREGDMAAGYLNKRLHLTTGAVTSLIDRLERRGLVQRKRDASDRRKVIVSALPENLSQGAELYLAMGQAFAQLLENYSSQELKFLIDHSQAVIALTQEQITLAHDRKPG